MKLGEDGMHSHKAGAPLKKWRRGQMVEEFKLLNGGKARNGSLSSQQASGLSVGDCWCWSASTVTCCSLH
jgi:hypothetical protein